MTAGLTRFAGSRHAVPVAVGALLLMHAGCLAYSGWVHAPGYDEGGHLAAGLSHWKLGRFDLYRVNPPLVRMVATLPVLAMHTKTDWTAYDIHPSARAEFPIGETLVSANGERSLWFFTAARWAVIPLSLLGGYVCYRWARELYGTAAGLLAPVLWCFSPNLLAHASMMTPDAGAAALGLLAGYFFWKWLREPDWLWSLLAGAALGLAELSKFTWIILFGLWPLLWVMWKFTKHESPSGDGSDSPGAVPSFAQLAAILLVAVYLINAGYAFEGSFQKLGDYEFVSRTLGGGENDRAGRTDNRFRGTWLAHARIPVPKNYLQGIDRQKLDFERGKRSYLRGEWREGGWWYYYLYAMLVKVPLGTWLLAGLALSVSVRGVSWKDELVLLAPAVCVLMLVSSQTGFNHHLRYVLPAFPLLFVWISRVGRVLSWRHHKVLTCVAAGALTWSVGSSLWVYPHSLSYFNELVGGPKNGHAHLVDSNIDWGQDLLYLKKWYDAHPEARPLGLAYFGFVDPRIAGIEFTLPPQDGPHPGWYAVSVNFLRGLHFSAPNGRSGKESLDRAEYTYFLHFEPVAMAGYSIYIYHVTEDEANRVRREMGLPLLSTGREDEAVGR